MNILYITNPSGVNDQSYFFYHSNKFYNKVFIICDTEDFKCIKPETKELLKDNHVILLEPIPPFSIFKFHQTIKGIKTLKNIIRTNQIDIVHIIYATPNVLWFNYIGGVKKIVTLFGSDILITIRKIMQNKNPLLFRDLILKLLLKSAFRKTNIVTATSKNQIRIFQKYFNKNPILIRTGIPLEKILNKNFSEYLPIDLKNKKMIFFPRCMKPVYNHELEIKAIAGLPETILAEYLFVFTECVNKDNNYCEKIRTQLKQINSLKYIMYKTLTTKQMYSIYQNARLTVMVPLSDGTPNSALEAMALKCPVIMGNVDYDEDIFENSCMRVLDYSSSTELKNKITEALINYPEEFIETGFNRVAKFVDKVTEMEKIEEIYTSFKQAKSIF